MITNDVHIRLKKARQNKGFASARSFAKNFNVPESTYTQHESGKRQFSVATLFEYSKFLDISPMWLLTGEKPKNDEDELLKQLTLSKKSEEILSSDSHNHSQSINFNLLGHIIARLGDILREEDSALILKICYFTYNKLLNIPEKQGILTIKNITNKNELSKFIQKVSDTSLEKIHENEKI